MKYRTRRRPTDFETKLETQLGPRRACIVDATDEGIQVQLEMGNLDIGDLVDIVVNDRRYPATTIWAKEGNAGLKFDTILPPSIFALIARQASANRNGKHKRFLMG